MKKVKLILTLLISVPLISNAQLIGSQVVSGDMDLTANGTTIIDLAAVIIIDATGTLTVNNLNFQNNAASTITVQSGGNLVITGDVLNNLGPATITIEHGGSFSPANNASNATTSIIVQKTASSTGFSYITPLVSSHTFPFHVYEYNESNIDGGNSNFGTWETLLSGDALTVGKGYAASAQGAISFTGTPNVANVIQSLTLTNAGSRGTNGGHHLIGNPYTAAINMTSFFATTDNATNTYASYYIWEPDADDYTSYTAAGGTFVSSGQAFFIQLDYSTLTDNSSYNIEFDPSIRVTGNNTDFFRTSSTEYGEIALNIKTENDLKNKLVFRFDDSFTAGYDKGFEAYPFQIENTKDLKVYSTLGDEKFDILALPLNGDLTIPITLTTKDAYDVTSEVTNYSSLPEGYKFELVNIETNEVLELGQNAKITSNMSKSDGEVKFELKVTAPNQILSIDDEKPITIYTLNNQLIFKDLALNNNNSRAVMYSLDGRVINDWTIPAGISEYSILLSGNLSGLYIVKVQSISGQYLKKIILK